MNRLAVFTLSVALAGAACGSSSTSPSSNTKPTLTAVLLPANEVPPVSNAEANGSGAVTVTWDVTKDASGNITAATANFSVTLSGFPAGTPVNLAHIHEGAATCACPVRVNLALTAGDITLANGSGTFSKSVSVDAALATAIINNPSAYYFNVHSTLNPGGFARGQLAALH